MSTVPQESAMRYFVCVVHFATCPTISFRGHTLP